MPGEICVRSLSGLKNHVVLASLVTSRKCFFDFFFRLNVPCALKNSVVGVAVGAGMLVADSDGHIVGVGVGLWLPVGVGVGEKGVPAQMARLLSDFGGTVTTVLLLPPPPQLQINAKVTNDATGTTTRHLRHQSIAH
jgi:hypothetical protein